MCTAGEVAEKSLTCTVPDRGATAGCSCSHRSALCSSAQRLGLRTLHDSLSLGLGTSSVSVLHPNLLSDLVGATSQDAAGAAEVNELTMRNLGATDPMQRAGSYTPAAQVG